jgi:hypothetical protein
MGITHAAKNRPVLRRASSHRFRRHQSLQDVGSTAGMPLFVADFPNLTPCQQQRVQNAIDTVLAPHEQEHVAAFQRYNGTISTPFNLTICRSRFNAEIQAMHNAIESSQRSSAQGASDALDPFSFDVDINCSG